MKQIKICFNVDMNEGGIVKYFSQITEQFRIPKGQHKALQSKTKDRFISQIFQ